MFVRQKKNKSGKISVQVIDKSSGTYKVIHTVGSSTEESVISGMVTAGQLWIKNTTGLREFDFSNKPAVVENVLNEIQSLTRVGYDLLLGRIFDEIGFDKINDKLFRDLVIARIAYPRSKLKTTTYLYRYKQISWDEDQVYRYLDKLYSTQKELVQQISYDHTLRILNNEISIVFYDVTTLYFEVDHEDELRKTGFSKEGKHQNPQIVLGLLVSKNGYPLAYEIFEGNKFEGHTMLPVIDGFKEKFNLDQLVVIADSGLLSKSNIDELQQKGYSFILGARIKNENEDIKRKILQLRLDNGQSAVINKDTLKLVITHSNDRAKKDRYNREKGLRKLEKQIKTGKLTKSNINNRGYNKFLKMEGEIKVAIDKIKLEEDSSWDGLKGYLTNANLSKAEVIENYQHLWQIEKAFRIAKTDLKIRPVYHRLQKRIEAHICISFVAYKIFKELERQLAAKKANISANTAIEIAETIHQVKVVFDNGQQQISKLLLLTQEQKYLAKLFNF
jgi:transposase